MVARKDGFWIENILIFFAVVVSVHSYFLFLLFLYPYRHVKKGGGEIFIHLKFIDKSLTVHLVLMEIKMLSVRKILTTGIAIVTLASGLAAVTPAHAWGRGGWGHGGFGGGGWGHRAGWGYGGAGVRRGIYYGGGWGYRGGYYGGGWGYPGYGAGLAGAAIGGAVVGAAIANSNRCYQHYPRYDAWGNFVGYTTGVGACY